MTATALAPNDLTTDNIRLAYWWAGRYRRRAAEKGIALDDLAQVAAIGLLRAAQGYDAEKGEFPTYARKWVRGVIASHLAGWRPHQALPVDDDGDQLDPEGTEDTLADAAEHDERAHHVRLVAHYLRFLHPEQRQVVCRHYGIQREKLTLEAHAALLGVSVTAVTQALKVALERLRHLAWLERAKAKHRAAASQR